MKVKFFLLYLSVFVTAFEAFLKSFNEPKRNVKK